MQSLLSDIRQSSVPLDKYGITINSLDGKYLYVNQTFAEIVGYTEEELLEMSYMDITHPDDIETNVNLDKEIIQSDTMPFFEMHKRYFHKNESLIEILLKVGVIKGEGDMPDRYIAFVLDKQDLESVNSENEKSNNILDTLGEPWNHLLTSFELIHKFKEKSKRKSKHLANTVHELRTPLNTVKACTGFLLNSIKDGETSDNLDYLKYISKGSDQLTQIVSQIIDYELIELGHFKIKKMKFDLNLLLKEVVDNLQAYANQQNLKLINHVTVKTPVYIQADQERLRSVFNNLISNGIKYTLEGEISISIQQKDGIVEIAIKDTGVGISEDDQKILFDESKKVYSKIPKEVDSIGLGLVITKKIVDCHQGKLTVNSAINEGSTFTVSLPLT